MDYDNLVPAVRSKAVTLLRRRLERSGYEVRRRMANNGSVLPVYEVLIAYAVADLGRSGLVQIGANDGRHDDPVQTSIRRLNLPSLLVEPLPDMCSKLESNYADCTDIVVAQVAVSDAPGTLDLYRVRADAPVAEWAHGLASLDRSVLLRHRHWDGLSHVDMEAWIDEVPVEVVTFSRLLEQFPAFRSAIVLQVDTEGHDLRVLKSALVADFLPPIVNYEHKHLSLADQEEARQLLTDNGYSLMAGPTDTLAARWRDGHFLVS